MVSNLLILCEIGILLSKQYEISKKSHDFVRKMSDHIYKIERKTTDTRVIIYRKCFISSLNLP
ncbi:hypothetical protein RyT2_22250 [Pseudolactococcus yaeyamensis]